MKTHLLKIDEVYFDRLEDEIKTCELRKNDRDYQAGDILVFKTKYDYETMIDGEKYEDGYWVRNRQFKITHVLSEFAGIEKNYVVLSLKKLNS